jgi:uncharacterized membrane protein
MNKITMTSNRNISIARSFYAIALIAFGIQHLLFKDFIAGRAPSWPPSLPGQVLVAYVTGLILITSGLAVLANKKARLAMIVTGIIILLWAGLRNIYQIVSLPEYGGLLTNTFKALTLGSGAFIVASSFFNHDDSFFSGKLISRLSLFGKYSIALFLLVGGIQHFLFADFVKFLIPAWIPGALFWTYFAGIALIAVGVAIMLNIKTSLATLLGGCMVLAWVLLLHLPRALENHNQNEWTAVFEALAVSGLLFLLSFQQNNKQ